MAVLDTVKAEIEDLKGSITRERAYQIKRENYRAIIEHITELQEASEPLPDETPFTSYDEWLGEAEKDLKSVSTYLANIEKLKDLYVALSKYVEQNPEV